MCKQAQNNLIASNNMSRVAWFNWKASFFTPHLFYELEELMISETMNPNPVVLILEILYWSR